MTKSTSELFFNHIQSLLELAEAGDLEARKSLACMSLLAEGWRYGDPDPEDGGPDGDDGESVPNIVHLKTVTRLLKRAA